MFDEVMDMEPFCVSEQGTSKKYRLIGVVIHHGTGFKSGHYTANCWNKEAGYIVILLFNFKILMQMLDFPACITSRNDFVLL